MSGIGTKREVWHGYALKTKKGLTRKDLYINENGRIAHKGGMRSIRRGLGSAGVAVGKRFGAASEAATKSFKSGVKGFGNSAIATKRGLTRGAKGLARGVMNVPGAVSGQAGRLYDDYRADQERYLDNDCESIGYGSGQVKNKEELEAIINKYQLKHKDQSMQSINYKQFFDWVTVMINH